MGTINGHSFLSAGNKLHELESSVHAINANFSDVSHLVVYQGSEPAYLAYQHMFKKESPEYGVLYTGIPIILQLDTILNHAHKSGKTRLILLFSHFGMDGRMNQTIEYFKEKQYPIIYKFDTGAVLLFVDIQ